MSRARLILQADDFGMCDAVNEGIAQAFRAGTVSQASVMVPCPAFESAAALARELGIPVGVHGTLNCEWDHLRWGPLTEGATLVEGDGTQHRTVAAAALALDPAEAGAELLAQHARLAEAGPAPVYIDCHMGPSSREGYTEACRATGLPFLYPMIDASLRFDSIEMLSDKPARKKRRWLRNHLKRLAPGTTHLVVSHPATDAPELRGITREDNDNYVWAVPHRTSDLDLLVDPDLPKLFDELDVELITAADV
ncbi:MAG: ChbG/HpnK family deacetylase [bacterium]|nr:ChbG/HpnK family deacetylase [bacterium]